MMNIFQCLNTSTTSYLECVSQDGVYNKCECNKQNIFNTYTFSMHSSDLYLDLSKESMVNANKTDYWYLSQPDRINDCFGNNYTDIHWKCETFSNNFYKTICRCKFGEFYNQFTIGSIKTKSLYKGLQDIVFPLEKKSKKNLTYLENDNNRSKNSNFYSYNLSSKNFSISYMLFIVIFLFICSLGFLIWIHKDFITSRNCRKKNLEEEELLIFIAELEAVL